MTVLSRMARLFRADLHGLLDQIEEPDLLLKQALREMEAEHRVLTDQADSLQRQNARLQQSRQRQQQELAQLQDDLALCLAQHNDDLARALLRKQLVLQRNLEGCALQLEANQKQHQRVATQVEQQRSELERIRQQAQQLDANKSGMGPSVTTALDTVTDAEVEVALLRAKAQFQTRVAQSHPDREHSNTTDQEGAQ
ncbi:MAG: PspA/IM30 family protein [Pseudomonadota bacterium]|nr:PspA/IM30 family protein [Pseudomonadota bacterium]